ncbi:MAG TPA: hypothetical protein VD962_05560 [Rubricoccaceae bacterium]|nr:hypothetical protein [Rubricoccaceae bacterium]
MANQTSSPSPAARSVAEVALGFLGAALVLPLLFRMVAGVFRGVFRLGLTRKLIGEAVFVGVTTLLTRDDVLDKLFGRPGRVGDGALKPGTPRRRPARPRAHP